MCYLASAAPRYTTAFCVNIGMSAMTIIAATFLRFYLRHLNNRLDRGEEMQDIGSSPQAANDREEHGLPGTAVRRGFRFML